jgi:hypothetical protein
MAFKDLATQKHDDLTPEQIEAKAIHIFVDTDFKRSDAPGTPIFVLAMLEKLRYIRKLEDLVNKSFHEQMNEVSQIVRAHYVENKGKLTIWGEIKRYHFRYKADSPAIIFDTNGNIISESFLAEGHASLSVGSKDITSLLPIIGGDK